jgi:hypothetical protein
MVYLVIKELSNIAEDVIMVTSSIMKDMQPNLEVIYRPNAIRALARVIDVRLAFPFPFFPPCLLFTPPGIHDRRCRAFLQGRHCRPQHFHLLRRPRFLLPPPPRCEGRDQALGERSR